jgi:hypothetical protein
MERLLTALVVLLCLSCATPGPLNRAALRASHPRTILATLPPIPAFQGRTSQAEIAGALTGLVGLIVTDRMAEAEGKKARARQILDPADLITAVLMRGLAKRYALQVLDAGNVETSGTSAGELSREYASSDLVLDVRTSDWGFTPTRLGHYDIYYEGSVSLIDTRNKTVLAEGTCVSHPIDGEAAPSYEELMARDAALLKAKFRGLVMFCADDYRTRILGLYGQ